jgi:crotonobetainyl-CoA:carnitine CoA-transferase CaiB-like acyl-CoA transferase
MTADELVARLRAHDVPIGLINRAPDLLTDPHIAAREMIVRLAAGFAADVPMTGVVPRFSRTPGAIRAVGPALGEHTDAVLRALAGYSDAEVAVLRDGGVVA